MSNTTTLSDFDLMVLVSFEAKAEWEGSRHYTYENWPPKFESDALNRAAATYADFMGILRENRGALDAWEAAHREDACDLINAHRDEEDRREAEACLWAVRRNDGQIFTEPTRERAEYSLRPGVASPGLTFVVLHRNVPGGEWVEFNAEMSG